MSARLEDESGIALHSSELEAIRAAIPSDLAFTMLAAARRSGRFLEHDTTTIGALGTAARLVLPNGAIDATGAFELLSSISANDADGFGAFALGAIAFEPTAPSTLVLPECIVMMTDKEEPTCLLQGTKDRLSILRADPSRVLRDVPDLLDEGRPDHFELVATESHEEFKASVRAALTAILAGTIDKVVLAREVVVTANRPFNQHDLVERLRALYPSCATFAFDGFLGASPELLVRRSGRSVSSQPLAGTIARSGDPEEDARLASALLDSDKERAEHRFVVNAIAGELVLLGAEITVPSTPHLLELRNVVHLATLLEGSFPERVRVPSALELALAIHPTPAVGGFPKAAALSYLRDHETLERGRYAGPVGYVRGNGDGEFFIGIRSATIDANTARLYAGVGIVEGSDPNAELAETQLKLQALLSAAVRP